MGNERFIEGAIRELRRMGYEIRKPRRFLQAKVTRPDYPQAIMIRAERFTDEDFVTLRMDDDPVKMGAKSIMVLARWLRDDVLPMLDQE